MTKEITELIEKIQAIDSDDFTMVKLEEGMHYYCSNWDKCEGYKHAIIKTIEDQYTHHEGEADPEDIEKLKAILGIN